MQQISELKKVVWHDLVSVSKKEIFSELLLSLPWLIASWLTFHHNFVFIALFCSFMFFLTGLRQVHNAYHYALGINTIWTERVMFMLSILMLGSMHAVKYNHLIHHKHCLDEEDIEGSSAKMPGWKALLLGFIFPIKLHYNAWKKGNPYYRKWIIRELIGIGIFYSLAFIFDIAFLKYHFWVMAIGESLSAFFAVWTVHHDCDGHDVIARTSRGKWKSWLTYNMFYHVEHHLFPKVPTCHLPKLAERIDEVMPELKEKQVF